MQLGIPVTVGSVENYRRLLLEQKGLETDTFEHYLAAIASEKSVRKNKGKIKGWHDMKLMGVLTNGSQKLG